MLNRKKKRQKKKTKKKKKIDNINSLKIGNINFGYLLHEFHNEMKENRIFYINLHILLHASTDRNAAQQVFLIVIQENSNYILQWWLIMKWH